MLRYWHFALTLVLFLPLLVACPSTSEPKSPDVLGTVWNDLNENGSRESGEPGLEGFTVYLDNNNNAQLDAEESSTTTDANGDYSFDGLANGSYQVRQVLDFGWRNISGGNTSSLVASQVLEHSSVARRRSTRIVGGREAAISDYPFMVALGEVDNEANFFSILWWCFN